MKKRIIISVCALLVICLVLGFVQMLVVPKYDDNKEGALVHEYYAEKGNHDVIFVGDCEMYEGIIPAKLFEEYGISSYVRGSAQQLVWHSYYLLEETLKYETPKAVVYNVMAMKYDKPQKEAYNRMTLDGMKFSMSKLKAINVSMTEDENFIDYLFPILRYHSRITKLKQGDFKYMFEKPKVSHSGYLMQTGIQPRDDSIPGRNELDYEIGDTAWKYLDKMKDLCEKKGIQLILVKSPTNSWRYWWQEERDEQIREYAEKNGLPYYNFIPKDAEMGIDWSKDTYDKGAHLNVYGAEKFTSYLGNILVRDFGFEDRRDDAELCEFWEEKLEIYYKERNA